MESSSSSQQDHHHQEEEGSWIPFWIIIMIILIRYICYSNNSMAIRIRRYYNLKIVALRKGLGLHNTDHIYTSGSAGKGASTQLKRQG